MKAEAKSIFTLSQNYELHPTGRPTDPVCFQQHLNTKANDGPCGSGFLDFKNVLSPNVYIVYSSINLPHSLLAFFSIYFHFHIYICVCVYLNLFHLNNTLRWWCDVSSYLIVRDITLKKTSLVYLDCGGSQLPPSLQVLAFIYLYYCCGCGWDEQKPWHMKDSFIAQGVRMIFLVFAFFS